MHVFRTLLPDHHVVDWHQMDDTPLQAFTAAIVWMPPADFFDKLTALTHVFAFSAGVDYLLDNPGLPDTVSLIRLEDAGMGEQMAEYVLYGTLHAQRQMHEYRLAQSCQQWRADFPVKSAAETRVSILGAGALASVVSGRLASNGYTVSCWSRTPKTLPSGVKGIQGDTALKALLTETDILVCLLPLTPDTRHILNSHLFSQLPQGAYLINPARGAHLKEDDLLEALNSGLLSGALLDVFTEEPLPESHAFWHHPRIVITPHVAAQSLPEASARQIASNIDRVARAEQPAGLVDRSRGY